VNYYNKAPSNDVLIKALDFLSEKAMLFGTSFMTKNSLAKGAGLSRRESLVLWDCFDFGKVCSVYELTKTIMDELMARSTETMAAINRAIDNFDNKN
jgi:hypothetical protein